MKIIRSILIANRGEIASRIIRTCRKMGIRSAVIYSDADKNAPYVREADLALSLSGNSPEETYLNMIKVLVAAKKAKVDAIHPGYGFLAENADFARKCAQNGLIFIGPKPEAIESMGSKSAAKEIMGNHNVPLIPGYNGEAQVLEKFATEAEKIGFPVLLKASAGGGGKGMRIVQNAGDLEKAFHSAKNEAQNAFGDDNLILEKYFNSARHIEFQIFGDQHGNIIHLLERECSLQRRYQKVMEESPSTTLDDALRKKMGAAAVEAGKAIGYDNAGTVEFLLSPSGDFYFLEMNTRLQVEHPVTEMITGLDLVQMQIESAEGRALSVDQEDVSGNGYALEFRLYAEDPLKDFQPATGKIHQWSYPEIDGLRVESAVETGSEVSVFYDPMIAKIIVHDRDRATVFRKMDHLLSHLQCFGLTTNRRFLLDLTESDAVQHGNYDTHFLHSFEPTKHLPYQEMANVAVCAAAFSDWTERNQQRKLLKSIPAGWRNSDYQPQKQLFKIGAGEFPLSYRYKKDHFEVALPDWEKNVQIEAFPDSISLTIDQLKQNIPIFKNGEQWFMLLDGFDIQVTKAPRFPVKIAAVEKGGLVSPMPCQVQKIHFQPGDRVEKDMPVAILVSMKMENVMYSDTAGIVEEVFVKEGQNLEVGVLIMKIKPDEA